MFGWLRYWMAAGSDDSEASQSGLAFINARTQAVERANPTSGASSFPLTLGSLHVFATETQDVAPSQRVTWFVYGPPGETVTVLLERVQDTGGHLHPIKGDKGPAGTVDKRQFVLGPNYPQNVPVVFTAPQAAGSIKITWSFSGGGKDIDFNNVRVPNLVAFGGGAGIVLTGSTSKHPDNHFGIAALNSRVAIVGQKFFEKFQKPIYVNDMSLPSGGMFDISGQWRPPHQTHQQGRTVDINSTSMTTEEREFFRTSAEEAGLRVDLESSPEHWHLSI